MKIDELVEHFAHKELAHLLKDKIKDAQNTLKISSDELFDAVARKIVERYSKQTHSWSYCDYAINQLAGSAYTPGGSGLPIYAYDVYKAFEAGEFREPDDPPDIDFESRTRRVLTSIELTQKFMSTPVDLKYPRPSEQFIAEAKASDTSVLVETNSWIRAENHYFKNKIHGALPKVYLRAFLLQKLSEAARFLEPNYSLVIFDGYRSKVTQAGLFDAFFHRIKAKNPTWSNNQLNEETRKYVAHPNEPSRFEIPPHNSGGAVDVGLFRHDRPVDMGTEFDDITNKASTDFFEQSFDSASGFTKEKWNEIRINRRILFNALTSVGFVNWKHEWWHFDIGNCVWAQELGLPWIYDSMDELVRQIGEL